MKRIIIDTDPGDDDAAAILFCLGSGVVQVEAITVVAGNVEVEKCARNALMVLEAAGRSDIPVYVGASKPLLRAPRFAKWIHGEDGLGDTNLPLPKSKPAPGYAALEIVRRVMESPEELTILCLAALTNVAIAITIEPRIKERIKEIAVMGGAVRTGGNVTPVASFNIVVDPEAAFIVYQSGIPVVQVGLDVCDHVTETDAHLAMVANAHTPVTDFIIKVLEFRRTKAMMPVAGPRGEIRQIQSHIRAKPGSTDVRLNDVVAAGYVVVPTLFRGEKIYITIETKGEETAGMTVADFRGQLGKDPNATVLLEVNGQALADRWTRDIINCGR